MKNLDTASFTIRVTLYLPWSSISILYKRVQNKSIRAMNEYVNMVRTYEWLRVVLTKICLCAEYISVNVRGPALYSRDLLLVVRKAFDPCFAFSLIAGTVALLLFHPDNGRTINPLPLYRNRRTERDAACSLCCDHTFMWHFRSLTP
jgi:hypothetical protein